MIYLIIGLLKTATSDDILIKKIISIILIFLTTYLLDYICKTYGKTTPWYILIMLYLLPFILEIIIFSTITFLIFSKNSLNFFKSVKKIL